MPCVSASATRSLPWLVPIWDENKKVTGIIDVLNKRAYEMQNGKRVEIELPEGKEDVVTQFNDALKESVAETSEEFMDKFFSGEDFTYVEMIQGLRQGVRELSLFPVLCGSAVNTMGSLMLMDNIVELMPNPAEGNMRKGVAPDGTKEEFAVAPGGVPCAFVFKTVSDQYGKYSFIKVLSGNITSDLTLVDSRTGNNEKLGRLYIMRGKKAEEVKELSCGDIGAIGKMEKDRVKMKFLGDLSPLSEELQALCRRTEEISTHYDGCQVNICLNYGGRDEIVRAARAFAADCAAGRQDPQALDEAQFASYLYTGGIPDPDLVIRPSGELRLSNFLPWQSAYAEFYFTDVPWPDFHEEDLRRAVEAYNQRDRRYGKV